MAEVRKSVFESFSASMRYFGPERNLHFHVLTPLHSPPGDKNTAHLPLDSPAIPDLRVDLVCKMVQSAAGFGRQNFDKFILSAPYCVLWTFPLSFYAMAKINCSNEKLKKFLNQPILRYIRKGSDVTNQQRITLVQYVAYNTRQQEFFKSVANEFKCSVDVQVLGTPFEDFLAQIELQLFNTLDLNNILTEAQGKNFSFKIDKRNIGAQLVGRVDNVFFRHNEHGTEQYRPRDCTLLKFIVERRKDGHNHESAFRQIAGFWTALTQKVEGVTFSDFFLTVAAFDIEVGYTCSLRADQTTTTTTIPKTLPTFVNGFCQCICLRSSEYAKCISVEKTESDQYLYVPPNIADRAGFVAKWQQRIRDKGFWFKHNNCRVFESELEMIKQFLSHVLTYVDVIDGYNSRNFDFPFLVMRYNYLQLNNPLDVFSASLNYYK